MRSFTSASDGRTIAMQVAEYDTREQMVAAVQHSLKWYRAIQVKARENGAIRDVVIMLRRNLIEMLRCYKAR